MVRNLVRGLFTTAALLAVSGTASHATDILFPGQFVGLATGAPLPEGFIATDLESYGRADGGARMGVNIPEFIYSTPITFYDTRVSITYSPPFVHQDAVESAANPLGQDRVDFATQAFSVTFAHSFGNGFSASYSAVVQTPDVYIPPYTGTDQMLGLTYIKNGFNLNATIYYSGTFGSHKGTPSAAVAAGLPALTGVTGSSDAVDIDFSISKNFNKLELGFLGFAETYINRRADYVGIGGFTAAGAPILFDKRQGQFALGGLIGYDFGRFTLQGYVTRDIAKRFAFNGLGGFDGLNQGYGERETRGFFRIVAPLYVAPPPAAPVIARY